MYWASACAVEKAEWIASTGLCQAVLLSFAVVRA